LQFIIQSNIISTDAVPWRILSLAWNRFQPLDQLTYSFVELALSLVHELTWHCQCCVDGSKRFVFFWTVWRRFMQSSVQWCA